MLSKKEADALRIYSGSDYRLINGCLRGESPCTEDIRATVAAIDSAIAGSRLDRDMVLFRGIGVNAANRMRASGLSIGSTFTDDAFMSTSAEPETAEMFARFPPGGLMFKIHAPAGTAALDMAAFSLYPEEHEFLLPRQTTLRILGYDSATDELECEVVSHG